MRSNNVSQALQRLFLISMNYIPSNRVGESELKIIRWRRQAVEITNCGDLVQPIDLLFYHELSDESWQFIVHQDK